MPIPVYLFLGFLESGKTRFMQSALEDDRFQNDRDRSLVILCEDRMAYILAHKDETLAVIREQAAKLNGGPIKVRVREAGDEIIQENNAKVDELIGHAQELDIEIKTL